MSLPTSLAPTTDLNEYSRYEPDRDSIIVNIAASGTGYGGMNCSVILCKRIGATYRVVNTFTIVLSETDPNLLTVSLRKLVDDDRVSKVNKGDYFIRAVCTDGINTVTGESSNFRITPITVDSFKKKYLYGVTTKAFEVKDVKNQPFRVTGVTVTELSKLHPVGWFPLSYNYDTGAASSTVLKTGTVAAGSTSTVVNISGATLTTNTYVNDWLAIDDGAGNYEYRKITSNGTSSVTVESAFTVTMTVGVTAKIYKTKPIYLLSWCGGPSESITADRSIYMLRKGSSDDYIQVKVSKISSLPTSSVSEELFVDSAVLSPEKLQSFIDSAYSEVQNVVLGLFLEPTILVTEEILPAPGTEAGSDLPTFTPVTWDQKVDSLTFKRPNPNHWMYFVCPYRPVIRFESLYGKTGKINVIDFDKDWVQFHELGGFVELVPFSGVSNFNIDGLALFGLVRGAMTIPNFWNFRAVVGFKELPAVIKELIEKKAAIMALSVAGQAYRGGLSSSSISRDGVSEGVSYLNSGPYGLYSGTINTLNGWVQENEKKIRAAFLGTNLVSLGS